MKKSQIENQKCEVKDEELNVKMKITKQMIEEAELDECWSTHERVPGTKKGAKGSCRPKTNENEDVRDTYDDEVVKQNEKDRKEGAKKLLQRESGRGWYEPHI